MKSNKKKFSVFSFWLIAYCLQSTISFAQPMQVQNAYMYLKEKSFDKAKVSADAAVLHEKTKDVPKAWLYRGQVYQAIFQDTSRKVNQLDAEAQEKAVESFVKCYQLDKDQIYKSDLKAGLSVSAGSLLNKAENYLALKQYDKTSAACELLKSAVPFDSDELLKRRNVTVENIMYLQYRAYYLGNDAVKAKEIGNKLTGMNYKVPLIYSTMAKLFLADKDTTSALSYLDKGLALFDDNIDLLTMQIDILMMQKKTALLKEKLESAVEASPNSDIMHAALANVYEKSNNREKAEEEYKKAMLDIEKINIKTFK